jgi:hypothetical protein
MAESFFIDDGYTQTDIIAARPGKHAELSYDFRPVGSEKLAQFFKKTSVNNGADEYKVENELLAEHIVSWTINAPVNIENIKKLHPSIRTRMLNVVTGYSDPEVFADQKN